MCSEESNPIASLFLLVKNRWEVHFDANFFRSVSQLWEPFKGEMLC
jgi:hypothetical protein